MRLNAQPAYDNKHRFKMFGNSLTWQWEVYLTERRFHWQNFAALSSKLNLVFFILYSRHKNEMTGTLTLLLRSLLSSRGETGWQTKNFPLRRWSFFPAVKAGSNQSIPTSTPMMPRGTERQTLSATSYVNTRWQQSEGHDWTARLYEPYGWQWKWKRAQASVYVIV